MGLSSSKTTTKTNQSTTGNEQTSGTTQPITPDWLLGNARDYVERIGEFGQQDPNSFVAGSSPLQQMAWGNVGALSGWQGQARTAAELAQQAGSAGPNYAGRVPYGGMATKGGPQVAQAPAGLVPGQGYGGGPAFGYNAPQLGSGQGYAAARIATPMESQASFAADNMGRYQNSYTDQVVNASLAQFDRGTQEQQAQLAAQQARTGAFGGSRAGIAQGQLAADAALGRGTLAAGLNRQGFLDAAQLGGQDAAARNDMSRFNAGLFANRDLAQAGMDTDASRYGADTGNQFALQNANFNQNAGQFNAAANNQMSQFNAGQGDQAQARALQAAQLLQSGANDYGAGTRADLGTMAALGDQQRGVEQQYADAPWEQLLRMGQASGLTPYQILVGQQIAGTSNTAGTMQGTNVTKSSPNLFASLLQLGQNAAQAYAGGMGGG